jgi:hypothetical protein
VTCGAYTPDGDFLEFPEFDMDSLLLAWREAVFFLYLAEGKIEPEVVDNMRSWEHSGFSVDQSVLLSAGDQAGIERLVQYMVRCPLEPVSAGQGTRRTRLSLWMWRQADGDLRADLSSNRIC